MVAKNFGILTSIDWNSNKWQSEPTEDDLSTSNFGHVIEEGNTHTFINFAHEIYPPENDGYYGGQFPQLWSRMPDKEKSRYVEVTFIKSHNWKDKQNYIVGLYAFPIFLRHKRISPLKSFAHPIELNVKSFPKDILLLENYINLNEHDLKKFLPAGKDLGKQGYNYLTKENVFHILDVMSKENQTDKKLSGIKLRLILSIDKKK